MFNIREWLLLAWTLELQNFPYAKNKQEILEY